MPKSSMAMLTPMARIACRLAMLCWPLLTLAPQPRWDLQRPDRDGINIETGITASGAIQRRRHRLH